jgi:hypothetical protein
MIYRRIGPRQRHVIKQKVRIARAYQREDGLLVCVDVERLLISFFARYIAYSGAWADLKRRHGLHLYVLVDYAEQLDIFSLEFETASMRFERKASADEGSNRPKDYRTITSFHIHHRARQKLVLMVSKACYPNHVRADQYGVSGRGRKAAVEAIIAAIRDTAPNNDPNRSRWTNHPIWDVVIAEMNDDLLEMHSGANLNPIKEVHKETHISVLIRNILGTSISLAALNGVDIDGIGDFFDKTGNDLKCLAFSNLTKTDKKLNDAKSRYAFSEWDKRYQIVCKSIRSHGFYRTLWCFYVPFKDMRFYPIDRKCPIFQRFPEQLTQTKTVLPCFRL